MQANHNTSQPIIVIKIGGASGVDFTAICQDIKIHDQKHMKTVLVHGGSAEANSLGEALGVPPKFITSPSGHTSRYTNRATLEIFIMAVNGKVNTLLVEQLQKLEINALGLCGMDGKLIQAERKEAVQSIENGKRKIIRDDQTGKICSVNKALLATLLDIGFLPVIAPLAISQSGEALNVDADRAASAVAAALHAEKLIFFTSAPGLLSHFPDEQSLIHQLPASCLPEALTAAQGRMKKKIIAAEEALKGGVQQVIIADGRAANPLTRAMAGEGTIIS